MSTFHTQNKSQIFCGRNGKDGAWGPGIADTPWQT